MTKKPLADGHRLEEDNARDIENILPQELYTPMVLRSVAAGIYIRCRLSGDERCLASAHYPLRDVLTSFEGNAPITSDEHNLSTGAKELPI